MARRDEDNTRTTLVLSYLGLRRAIGVIGIALPFALAIGKVLLDGPGLEPSLSDYYYTGVRNVFVGSLCAIGVFLFSYRYARPDAVAGIVGSISAVGVALFPTTERSVATGGIGPVGIVHVVCAAAFFLTLAYFCLALFPRTHPDLPPTPRKVQRNVIYRVCGVIVLACVVLAGLTIALADAAVRTSWDAVFWLESLADVAFGVAWFVKGETILRD